MKLLISTLSLSFFVATANASGVCGKLEIVDDKPIVNGVELVASGEDQNIDLSLKTLVGTSIFIDGATLTHEVTGVEYLEVFSFSQVKLSPYGCQ